MSTPLTILLWLLVGAVGLYVAVGLITTLVVLVLGNGMRKGHLRVGGRRR